MRHRVQMRIGVSLPHGAKSSEVSDDVPGPQRTSRRWDPQEKAPMTARASTPARMSRRLHGGAARAELLCMISDRHS